MNLPALLDNTKDIELRPVAEREGSIIAYRRILIAVIRDIQRAVSELVLPTYTRGLLDSVNDERGTTRRRTAFTVVNQRVGLSVNTANRKMEILFDDEQKSHLVRISASIKKGTGLDVAPYLNMNRDEIDLLVKLYIEQNATLIKSLSDDLVNKVEAAVYRAKVDRTTYVELTKILQKQYGIAKNRADLIAFDQLASINSDFSRSRAESVGLKKFRWRTRMDGDRVRPLHRQLNGQIFEWGKPTLAENGLPPGKPVRCRCNAVPLLPANEKAVAAQEKLRRELTKSNTAARAKAKAEAKARRQASN